MHRPPKFDPKKHVEGRDYVLAGGVRPAPNAPATLPGGSPLRAWWQAIEQVRGRDVAPFNPDAKRSANPHGVRAADMRLPGEDAD